MSVVISIVTWNHEQEIGDCLSALAGQLTRDSSVIVVDNNSNDRTCAIVEKFPEVRLMRSSINSGYSGGHNQAIRASSSDYVLCLNPDVVVGEGMIDTLLHPLQSSSAIGSAGPKVFRIDHLKSLDNPVILDCTGLVVKRDGRVINRGEGELDRGQYDNDRAVFGQSGSVVMFRRSALEATRQLGEYFDSDFFAYKEDVDLAWRMLRAGFSSRYVPEARAFHVRRVRSAPLSERLRHVPPEAFLSYRNHLLLMVKHAGTLPRVVSITRVLSLEVLKAVVYAIRSPKILITAWRGVFQLRKKMLMKRRMITLYIDRQ